VKPNKIDQILKKIKASPKISELRSSILEPKAPSHFVETPLFSSDDVCILAGDIGSPYSNIYDTFMKHIHKCFVKTFVIAGNHEYYHKSNTMVETNQYMEDYFLQYDNITFLHNRSELYRGYHFIGSTLWSNITKPAYTINDVIQIPDFDIQKYNGLNKKCVKFLNEEMESIADNCIIITHHMPSESLIHEKYKTLQMLPYNQWFYCDMNKFMEKYKDRIKCWFYGHTHCPAESILHGIHTLCNPIGYPNENSKIDYTKYFDVLDLE